MTHFAVQVHAAGKPISHEGGEGYETEALLHQAAERTVGYSGAELAGLLNEAAILAVCTSWCISTLLKLVLVRSSCYRHERHILVHACKSCCEFGMLRLAQRS